jgi:diguanylate cyclase (GGDEF)-like protein
MPNLLYKELWHTISHEKPWIGEIENKTLSGEVKWVEVRITPIVSENGILEGFNAVYHDIINKKLLEKLYITDPLTQIYYRGYFDDLMSAVSKQQRKADTDFIIIIADIDHFKVINDTYGHQVGDEALKDVANALKSTLRDNDVIARWGGEEFVIMLKNITIEEAQIIAEKLRVKIEQTKVQGSISLTTSFGLTKYYVGEDTNHTFKRADDALYEAKKTGRNIVITKL